MAIRRVPKIFPVPQKPGQQIPQRQKRPKGKPGEFEKELENARRRRK